MLSPLALAGGSDASATTDPAAAISPARARSMFFLHCAGCHSIDGGGHPNVGVPSMRNTLGYFLGSPAGRALIVQVPGARNASISDAELAALTNWELMNFSKDQLPADFVPYTAAEVTQARPHPPLDVAVARSKILRDLHEGGKLPDEAYQALTGDGTVAKETSK
jgi:mono/diheme cytochrome c family protein